MKRSTIVAIAAAATLAIGSAAVMAGSGKHRGNPEQQLEMLTERLGLFDDQVPKVEAILAASAAERQQIRETYTLSQKKEAREAMRAVKENMETSLATVLTDDQQARFDELKAERRDRRGDRRKGRNKTEEAAETETE